MYFLGKYFTGDPFSWVEEDLTPEEIDRLADCKTQLSIFVSKTSVTIINNMNNVSISNAYFDTLHISTNVEEEFNDDIPTWDMYTILSALFDNNLSAGTFEYSAEDVDYIRIKRREVGSDKWLSIKDIPIETDADFEFTFIDKYAKGNNTKYEYALVPILNGVEGNYNIGEVVSDFEGLILADKDELYYGIANLEVTTDRHREATILTTRGSKYPYTIINGKPDYTTGNVTVSFIPFNKELGDYDIYNARKYKDKVNDFLQNGKAKILKLHDGRIWLVNTTGTTSEFSEGHELNVNASFTFTEVGDPLSVEDLKRHGLIEVF